MTLIILCTFFPLAELDDFSAPDLAMLLVNGRSADEGLLLDEASDDDGCCCLWDKLSPSELFAFVSDGWGDFLWLERLLLLLLELGGDFVLASLPDDDLLVLAGEDEQWDVCWGEEALFFFTPVGII